MFNTDLKHASFLPLKAFNDTIQPTAAESSIDPCQADNITLVSAFLDIGDHKKGTVRRNMENYFAWSQAFGRIHTRLFLYTDSRNFSEYFQALRSRLRPELTHIFYVNGYALILRQRVRNARTSLLVSVCELWSMLFSCLMWSLHERVSHCHFVIFGIHLRTGFISYKLESTWWVFTPQNSLEIFTSGRNFIILKRFVQTSSSSSSSSSFIVLFHVRFCCCSNR